MRSLVFEHAPQLLQCRGTGPDSAAALLIVAGDNPERLTHEGSYAALCGVSPIEASSEKTHRLRLNHGGDRQANAALYRITLAAYAGTRAPAAICNDVSPKAKPAARPSVASSATSPRSWPTPVTTNRHTHRPYNRLTSISSSA